MKLPTLRENALRFLWAKFSWKLGLGSFQRSIELGVGHLLLSNLWRWLSSCRSKFTINKYFLPFDTSSSTKADFSRFSKIRGRKDFLISKLDSGVWELVLWTSRPSVLNYNDIIINRLGRIMHQLWRIPHNEIDRYCAYLKLADFLIFWILRFFFLWVVIWWLKIILGFSEFGIFMFKIGFLVNNLELSFW